MFNSLTRFSNVALAAFILFTPSLLAKTVEAQNRVPDYGNMEVTDELPVTGVVDAIGFTPDGTNIIASDNDKFRVWNANTAAPIRVIEAPNRVRSNFILFTKDGKTMITAGSDAALRLWDFDAGTVKQTLTDHRGFITGLVLSPSGKLLASSSSDRTVCIWDMENGQKLQEFSTAAYPISILVFSEDEKTLTTFGTSAERNLMVTAEKIVWNVEGGEPKSKDVLNDFGAPFAVTPDGKTLVGVATLKIPTSSTRFDVKRGLRLYDIDAGEFKTGVVISHSQYASFVSETSRRIALQFSPNKAVLTIRAPQDRGYMTVYLWGGGEVLENTNFPKLPVSVSLLAFSPDSRMIATWTDDLKVNLLRAP